MDHSKRPGGAGLAGVPGYAPAQASVRSGLAARNSQTGRSGQEYSSAFAQANTKISGADEADFGFTGRYYYAPSERYANAPLGGLCVFA
jgi:hypothetical protein